MEVKKNPEVDGERVRLPLSMLGFLIIGSLILASFSYRTPVEDKSARENKKQDLDLPMETETKQEEEPPPPPEDTPPPPPAQEPVLDEELEVKENEDIDPPPPIDPAPVKLVQEEEPEPPQPPIVDFPDVEAGFPGGAAAMKQFLIENTKYPEISRQMGDQGKVYVKFVVERDGSISGIEIIKSVSKELDREAKRVVRSMPRWSPGEKNGEPVRSVCRIPINFTLN